MVDVPFRSAKQLAADIRKKKIGCLEREFQAFVPPPGFE